MKKRNWSDNELRAEYNFATMRGGVRGKYSRQIRSRGTNVVLLDPEVADAFPSDASVNEALRGVLNTTRAVRGSGGLSNKTLQTRGRAQRRSKSGPRPRSVRS